VPKYIPTEDDLYSTEPCFICGRDVIEPGEKTCCHQCQMEMASFEEDYEEMMMLDLSWNE
jgi:predicted nucleic acid-binding Zn ribbon protein